MSPNFRTTALTAVRGALMGLIKFAGIITAVGTIINDAFMGYFKAEDWGVTKFTGILSSVFAGGAQGGLMNAFTNASKWAVIGAGIGATTLVPFGPFVGAVAGTIFGAFVGWFGSEKLGKNFEEMIADVWKDIDVVGHFESNF